MPKTVNKLTRCTYLCILILAVDKSSFEACSLGVTTLGVAGSKMLPLLSILSVSETCVKYNISASCNEDFTVHTYDNISLTVS